MAFLEMIFGDPRKKDLKRLQSIVDKANAEEVHLQNLSDSDFLEMTKNLKGKNFRESEETLVQMLSAVKNACRRLNGKSFEVMGREEIWNMTPYDVQMVGTIALLEGKISEMRTGEGKTLVAGMAAVIAALFGKGIHVVTVNDYLAERDAEWNTPLFEMFGLSVGIVIHRISKNDRKIAYQNDITYATNNELGFDYLRDNMAQSEEELVQRDLHFALVDEVDSILIDEARTPLIISASAEESTQKYEEYAKLVKKLVANEHFTVDEKQKTAILNENGVQKMEELLGIQNIYTEKGFSEVHHIEQALRALACFQRDQDYVVNDEDGVVIVDEFTGRLMPGRRYSDGLHQALEAKEGVEVRRQSRTLASITFQNYFRLYEHLAGMTGTAETEAEEFGKIYRLPVLPIPTNRPVQRTDKKDVIFKNEKGKFLAIAKVVKEKFEAGQPVLVGTASIEKSEILSEIFKHFGIPHTILNAKQHAREAEIIANAGQKNAITIATNMAGRGTDIRLGEGVKELGGLCILGSERHESRRIDNQLRGRAGRQGDPGETQFFVSLEDSLMRLFGSDKLLNMMNALNMPEDLPIENGIISSGIESAQKKVEGLHFDRRKTVLQYDDVMNRHREIVYARRKKILHHEDMEGSILEMIAAEVENLVELHTAERISSKWDLLEIFETITSFHHNTENFSLQTLKNCENTDEMKSICTEFLTNSYRKKRSQFPSDAEADKVERMIALRAIDSLFMEHLQTMSNLKEQVSLRAYGQRDPLMEYKSEAYLLFTKLLAEVRKTTLLALFHIEIRVTVEIPEENMRIVSTNENEIEEALEGGNALFSNPKNIRKK